MRHVVLVLSLAIAIGCAKRHPATTQIAPPGATPPQAVGPDPKFNGHDADETARWFHAQRERERTHKSGGNDYSNGRDAEMKGVWETPLKKDIDWVMEVLQVTEKGLVVVKSLHQQVQVRPFAAQRGEEDIVIATEVRVGTKMSRGQLLAEFPWRGDEQSLRALRAGDRVRVTGTISDLKRRDLAGTVVFTAFFDLILVGGAAGPVP